MKNSLILEKIFKNSIVFYLELIIISKEKKVMKNNRRNIRQEKLARLFFEMGMDMTLVSKLCRIEEERLKKIIGKNN